jgi:two-component system invasion response regulator UvrY
MNAKLTKIIIADDHGIVRRGIINIIRENWGTVNILQAETFEQTLMHLRKPADLLILDINMPGGNNVAMINIIKNMQERMKILIFSSYHENIFALRYLQAGANGYLSKHSDELEIIKAIQAVLEGRKYISEEMKAGLPDVISVNGEEETNPLTLLSNRELEVGIHLAQGTGVLEISRLMNLQMGTVSTYKARTFEKLGVKNIVALADKFKLYASFSSIVS